MQLSMIVFSPEAFSTATAQTLHEPDGFRAGWWQRVGMGMLWSRAALRTVDSGAAVTA